MNTYSAYKDSGEQWLGQIPAHWEMKRLAACFATRSENWKRGETLELLSLLKDVGIVPYSEKGNIGNTAKTDFSQYKVARKGDLVINSMNVIIGSLGITPMDGYISPAYYAFAPREGVNTRYYNYILSLRRAQQNIRRFSKGIMEIRLKISANDFLSIQYPVPPKDEQEAMVAYLDEQTAQIDNAIAREQKMIDLLEERKQIIIQHAVTKGLNPNAKMKDSGIEWIGEIPEGWNVKKIKFLFDLITKRSCSEKKIGLENIESKSGKYIETYSIYDGNGIAVEKGDIVYGKLRPYLCKAWLAEWECNAVGDFYVFRSKGDIEPQYAQLLFLSKAFSDECTAATYGAKMPRVSSDFIRSLSFAYPSSKEQKEILVYLEEKLAGIDRAIDAREKMIALLQERKQIIINEVVTGKIKVL